MLKHNHPVHPSPLHRGRGWGWVFLLHNLKIAYRNLMKYKFQNLVSVLALAVGMVTLAATHFVMKHFGNPAICDEPYFDRTYEMSFVKLHHEALAPNPEDGSVAFNTQTIRILEDIHTALTSGGGMVGVEKLFYVDDQNGSSQIIIEFPDSTERRMDMRYCFTMPEYLNFRGARSALTGEKIPVLNNDKAVLSETLAKFIFGDKNPVGIKIHHERFNVEEERVVIDTYTVIDVVKTMSTNDIIGNWAFFCMKGSSIKQ